MSFDITKHKWSERSYLSEFLICVVEDDLLNFYPEFDCGIHFNKQDAIAIAKHFKLTSEDLKCTE